MRTGQVWVLGNGVWQTARMDIGAIIMVVVLVVVMPVGILMSMLALAGTLGGLIGRDRDLDNVTEAGEPNEHLALSDANPYAAR